MYKFLYIKKIFTIIIAYGSHKARADESRKVTRNKSYLQQRAEERAGDGGGVGGDLFGRAL